MLWCEQDLDVVRVGGKPLIFPTSQAATDHRNSSQSFREDVTNPPARSPRTFDVITVTVT